VLNGLHLSIGLLRLLANSEDLARRRSGLRELDPKEKTAENTPLGTVVFNVVTPTLTVYLPERTKATGSGVGVIIAPGGHGFGMKKQGTSSDHWIDEFYYWLDAQGFSRPTAR
jgi:hypothetical protein